MCCFNAGKNQKRRCGYYHKISGSKASNVVRVQTLKQNGSTTFNQSSKPENRFCFGAL